MTVQTCVLHVIGDTPIVKAQHLDTGVCELYVKLECMNPGGLIKDRIIMDGAKFLGLLTRIDLLNYLRRRAQ